MNNHEAKKASNLKNNYEHGAFGESLSFYYPEKTFNKDCAWLMGAVFLI